MSRAAVFDAIANDTILNSLGINNLTVKTNHTFTDRPNFDGPFIVLRWEESTIYSQTYTGMRNGLDRAPRTLTVWTHIPKEVSDDYTRIDTILDRIDAIFDGMEHVIGSDGYTVTNIRKSGRSGDLNDDELGTIVRNAAYGVLSRKS